MDITKFIPRKLWVPGLLLVLLIVLATLPLYAGSTRELFISATALMYIALAVSWAMFSGPTGYMSLAVAAFFGVGIYTTAILRPVVPLGVIVVAAGIVSFIIALLVGLVTLRLKGIYFAIFTFGLVVLIGQLVLYYEIHIVGRRGIPVDPTTYPIMYYCMLGLAIATLLAAYFIRRSRLGLALQSIGGNEEAAAHMGVNTTRVKVITFAISAIFMGVAGAIMGARMVFVDPAATFSVGYSFSPVLMAVFGGMGQLYGPVIGAAIFSFLEIWLSGRFPLYYPIIFGIILILVILYLPGGLVGLIPKLRNRLGGVIAKFGKGGKAEQRANT
jgi:branched-chain amino acid transport system permease protein